jgi:uncharacterized protein
MGGTSSEHQTSVAAVGCFGSYARGSEGVGSDLDLIVILKQDAPRPEEAWAVENLPVPAELIVYTAVQWRELRSNSPRFFQTLER